LVCQQSLDSRTQTIHTVIYCTVTVWHLNCNDLDNKNWAVDFGGLKTLKQWLEDQFDHKLALDKNDPHIEKFRELEKLDLAEIRIFDGVGAEKFAEHAFNFADSLIRSQTNNRCYVVEVECSEHGANSAIYKRK
jgi:6-pyruvoyltetrahydropterin/6-carboxytetrahydropterin synthase